VFFLLLFFSVLLVVEFAVETCFFLPLLCDPPLGASPPAEVVLALGGVSAPSSV